MYIGRLQLKGFKSFGSNHDLILSSGFTAIVGPNGSGKSNILDALRWALGDSNAGRLRISRQSDLLFQGSVSVPSAKEAEVTIQLRDEKKTCQIKRRVTAPDGATAAFVDNRRQTLTELEDIKREWKLEGDKFAFIGQGEVAEVIQQRPLARRMKLEILFGIDIYRRRRTEASDRLDTVKDEYEQLRNIAAELKTRREEIAPEARRAAQLREILDDMENDRKLLYWLRRRRGEAEKAELDRELELIGLRLEKLAAWRSLWLKAAERTENFIAAASRAREEQAWALEQCKARYESSAKSGFASANALLAAGGRMRAAIAEKSKAEEYLKVLEGEKAKSDGDIKTLREELSAAETACSKNEEKWKELNKRLEDEKAQREAWRKEKGNLEGELEQTKAKLAFLGKEILTIKNKKAETKDPCADMDREIKRYTAERDRLLEEQEKIAALHSRAYSEVQRLAAEAQRARREAAQMRSKLTELSETAHSDLYPRPVQYLLSASKLNRLDASPRAVVDVFTCDTSLSSAFEAYLGGRQFQLLVDNLEEAGRCIDMLKTHAVGRATFLPLERCRPRFPDRSFRLPAKGIVGWATELIDAEEHWLPAIRQIMGDLLIVQNYAVGQEIVRCGFRGPVASLEGDVFQPGGTVSGGRSQRSGKTIEIKAQIIKLEKETNAASQKAEQLASEFKSAETYELTLSDRRDSYTSLIREADGKIAVMTDRKETFIKEQRRTEGERGRILLSLKEEGKRWSGIQKRLSELEEEWNKETAYEDDRSLLEERERLRAEAAVLAERLRSGFAMQERVGSELQNCAKKIWAIDEEIDALDRKCVKERGNLASVGRECLEISEQRKKLTADIEKHVSGYSLLKERLAYSQKKRDTASARLDKAYESKTQKEIKLHDIANKLEELIGTWEEQYEYPGADSLPDDTDIEALRKKIRDGDRKIKSFGEVDMGVLSEDKNLEERLRYLGDQLYDVKAGADELEKLIADADKQAHKIFTDALSEVDSKFSSLFRRLFGGGEAHLEMIEGETIWDAGVDVVARPPGKHPQSINQLSGGEQSLSAISLLFASMEVAGCPLAVLDEVDASLDEVNLRRFAELACEYAKNRQVLAMTHRRVTMESADVLYGVTLSEPGLSQVVGVKLEDWA